MKTDQSATEKRKGITVVREKILFSRELERSIFFYLTLIMLVLGLLSRWW